MAGISSKKSSNSEANQEQIQELIRLYDDGHLLEVLSKAEPLISLFPRVIVVQNLVAAANYGLKNLDQAIEGFQKVLALNPKDAMAYFNIGTILLEKKNFDLAVENYQKCLKINPNYAECHDNMGSAFKVQGNLSRAIAHFTNAINLKPNFAQAHYNLGVALQERGDFLEAIKSYKNVIKINPSYAKAFLGMGNALKDNGELDAAIESYKQAIKINPDYSAAYYNMGISLQGIKFCRPIIGLPEIIITLINRKNFVRLSDISPAAISLIKLEEVFPVILNRLFSGELEEKLEQSVSDLSKLPLLLKIMEVCPITDLEVEWLLTYLRSAILTNVFQLSASKEILTFQVALALQCFTNEYIYTQTDEDTKILDKLEKIVQQTLSEGKQPAPLALASLGSYKALHDYSWCHLLAIPDELKQLERRQISDIRNETLLRSEIPKLTEIMDDVSSKVRQQYEENPYPRWVGLGLPLEARSIADIAKNINLRVPDKKIYGCDAPKILIAGCGTGQHSIGTAVRFRNCSVLAVDLSLSSLAYAKRKTEELGLKNIEYMQADILDLAKLGRQFDMVESAGVLHHMDDPMAGWSVLTDCLRSGGLMKIGLYSELARKHVVKMRKEIHLSNFSSNDFSMKAFRTVVIDSDQKHHRQIVSNPDFYSLSALRDLLFHVQEQHFTIPQLQNCLTHLRLKFCGFEAEDTLKQFKISNIGPEKLYDLDKWNDFEQDNPSTFMRMYQFWCQKI